MISSAKVNIEVDNQHGPVVRVTHDDVTIAVYLHDETAVVTTPNGQYGLDTVGSWPEFKKSVVEFND